MAALHLRIDQDVSDAIDQMVKDRPGATRSDIAKYLLGAGMEATRGGLASVHEALAKLARGVDAQQQLAISTTVGVGEQLARDSVALRGSFDLINRLSIESLMILRQLAVASDPGLLTAAQKRAHTYYTAKLNGEGKTAGSDVPEERSA